MFGGAYLLDTLTRRYADLPELAARRKRCTAICTQPRSFWMLTG